MSRVRVSWRGPDASGRAKRGAAKGLFEAAEHVKTESQRLVPIEEATLERSAVADVDEGELRASVSYDTPYAVVQHEDLSLGHDPGRQAKYLEDALDSEREVVRDLIAKRIREELT